MTRIAVVYHSDTGNTEKMARLVAEGAQAAGVDVDVVRAADADVPAVVEADALALGSPDYYSYMAGELKTFFDRAFHHKSKLSGKPYGAFGSHGGGAKVVGTIEKLAQAIGMVQACPGVLSLKEPEAADAEACRKLGRTLAQAAR